MHDVNILDELVIEAGAFYVMDRGYIDFERLHAFTLSLAFFVVRTKEKEQLSWISLWWGVALVSLCAVYLH